MMAALAAAFMHANRILMPLVFPEYVAVPQVARSDGLAPQPQTDLRTPQPTTN
jgi:hypothetical protein